MAAPIISPLWLTRKLLSSRMVRDSAMMVQTAPERAPMMGPTHGFPQQVGRWVPGVGFDAQYQQPSVGGQGD